MRINELVLYPVSGRARNSPPNRLMVVLGRMILAAMSLVNSGKDCLVRGRNKAGLKDTVVSQTRTIAGEVGEMELLFSSVRWRGVLYYSVEGNQRLVHFIFKPPFQVISIT